VSPGLNIIGQYFSGQKVKRFIHLLDVKHHAVVIRTTEGTYTFSDGASFTLTGGTIGTSDATWSTEFTAWKDGQPKDDATKQEKQDCVKVSI